MIKINNQEYYTSYYTDEDDITLSPVYIKGLPIGERLIFKGGYKKLIANADTEKTYNESYYISYDSYLFEFCCDNIQKFCIDNFSQFKPTQK